VAGLDGTGITVYNSAMCTNGVAAVNSYMQVGIGQSSTIANKAGTVIVAAVAAVADAMYASTAYLSTHKPEGYHFYAMLESNTVGGTMTWYGNNGVPGVRQGGISAMVWM